MKRKNKHQIVMEALLTSGVVAVIVIWSCMATLGLKSSDAAMVFPVCWMTGTAVYTFLATNWRDIWLE